jgi:hypothetical protein
MAIAASPDRQNPSGVLDLQRSLGNTAVVRLLQNLPVATPGHSVGTVVPGTVVQRAGHKDAWSFTRDRRQVVKITAAAEADVYHQAAALGIAGVIPGGYAEVAPGQIGHYDLVRKLRAPKQGEKIIAIENLAQAPHGDHAPIILDAKIGFLTASGPQAEKEGVSMSWMKVLRHEVIDNVMTKSRTAGYRFEEGGEWVDEVRRFSESGDPDAITPHGIKPDQLAHAFERITDDLKAIYHQMLRADVTFVGSSALMVVFPSDPHSSTARMIDFAHPIKRSEETPEYFAQWQDNYTLGIANLIRDTGELAGDLQLTPEPVKAGSAEEMFEEL